MGSKECIFNEKDLEVKKMKMEYLFLVSQKEVLLKESELQSKAFLRQLEESQFRERRA